MADGDRRSSGEWRAMNPERLENLRVGALESRARAVRLFCVTCMGESETDARNCASRTCPLWPWAFQRAKREAEGLP